MKCPKCTMEVADGSRLCPFCNAQLMSEEELETLAREKEQKEKRDHFFKGLVGALLGTLAGGIVFLILNIFVFTNPVNGIVFGICILKGYEWLAGSMSLRGMITGLILVILAVLLCDRVDWIIRFSLASAESVEGIPMGMYIGRMLKTLGFALLGSLFILKPFFKKLRGV